MIYPPAAIYERSCLYESSVDFQKEKMVVDACWGGQSQGLREGKLYGQKSRPDGPAGSWDGLPSC